MNSYLTDCQLLILLDTQKNVRDGFGTSIYLTLACQTVQCGDSNSLGSFILTPKFWRLLTVIGSLEWIPLTTILPIGAKNVTSFTSSREIQDLQG